MKLKNIHLYNYVVIYTKNCEIYINKGNEQVYIPPRMVAIFEKNISFNIETIRKGDGVLYESFDMKHELLTSLRRVIEPSVKFAAESYTNKRSFKERIFKVKSCSIVIDLFKRLKDNGSPEFTAIYELAFLVSKCENPSMFAISLFSSVAVTFSERVVTLLFSDLTRKWKLSDIAEEMHISEISVRKRLEQECLNFNQLILDVRMNQAAKFIIRSDHQIGMIASLVGYTSVSYFIKTFKEYYGVTPKKFEIGIKENLRCNR
ncbi:helix-turn-helix domain-containing protein [Escherichia coli]|nr:AraC family transcriptional regulator [Escherichia coli]EFB2937324.1 AraC family transcriptional regulator [Escherichia coli]EFJ2207810.1 helix-turn-helix domain-containing protein [Escherichia coli]EFM1790331.1 helix-turn-helix domain-containing protein [Escherichia coli]MBC0828494.1 helix-turn-helix domain-containing protein [Escherichia coli]